jgi:hypothetical protein
MRSRSGNAVYALVPANAGEGKVYPWAENPAGYSQMQEMISLIGSLPGVRKVEVEDVRGEWDHESQEFTPSGFRRIVVRGTDKALNTAQRIINVSGFEVDPNSDHDHERCIASARAMGVPADYAHTPETYLSM